MATATKSRMLTPPELAQRWGVRPAKVVDFIKSGELKGIDISVNHGTGRPRYRISEEAIADFERRRTPLAPIKPQRRRRRADPKVTEYF